MLQLSDPHISPTGHPHADRRPVTLGLAGVDDLLQIRGGALVIVEGTPDATRLVCRHVVSANPRVPAVVHTAEPDQWTAELAAAFTGVPADAIVATAALRDTNPALDLTSSAFPMLMVTQAFPGPSLVAEAAGLRPSTDMPDQLGLVIVEDLLALAQAWSMTDAVDYLRGWAADLGATVVATAQADPDAAPLPLDRHQHVLDVDLPGGGDRIATLNVRHRASGGRWRHPIELDLGRIDLR